MRLSTASFSHHTGKEGGHHCEWEGNAWHYPVKTRIGKPAPYFEGMAWHGDKFKKINLKDYHGKYLVLFFYPLDFTFVCPTEIRAFEDKSLEFKKIGMLSIIIEKFKILI